SPAEGILETIGNYVIVERQAILVGVGVIVGAGGHVDKKRLGVPDVLHGMVYPARDEQQAAILLAQINDVDHFVGRRIGAVVVHDPFESALADKEAVVLVAVDDPAFHLAGTD